MKKLILIIALITIASCADKKVSKPELVTNYYNGFKDSNYEQIRKTLSDSLAIYAGDYVMNYSRESFYEHFKWDSVFQPKYELLKLETQEEAVQANIKIHSLKHEFLKNNPMECGYRFYFKSGKIRRIEELDCPTANWQVWQKQVNDLVSWIKSNHPELDGFISDLSMKGAQNYLKAIDLYKNREVELPPNNKELN